MLQSFSAVKAQAPHRIAFLDGLRGLAILGVVFFHGYVRWAKVMPFGEEFAETPFLAFGWLGVNLFFLISGFVVLLTLEKCTSFFVFMGRRWLRLFPAMLICLVLVFLTAPIFVERPLGPVSLRDLLPGLTFIDPYFWKLLIGSPQGMAEGVLWSIFIEVKFYCIAGLVYFYFGKRYLLHALLLLFLISIIATVSPSWLPHSFNKVMQNISWVFAAEYYGWFSAGVLYYLYFQYPTRKALAYAFIVAIAAALRTELGNFENSIAAIFLVLFFSATISTDFLKKFFANRIFVFVGSVSYPLYLLHENILVSSVIKLGIAFPNIPAFMIPLIPIFFLISLSALIAFYFERKLRSGLRNLFSRCRIISSEV